MKMYLIGGSVVDMLQPDFQEQEVKTYDQIDLADHSMEVVDVLFDRDRYTGKILTSMLTMQSGHKYWCVGDIRQNKDVVVREMGGL